MPEFQDLHQLLEKYFPEVLKDQRIDHFERTWDAYLEWIPQINVISRKDIENLAERHFLHSLAIAKAIQFRPGTKIMDAGTGGGFPGIPLALYFPEVEFHLVDSVYKKIKVVQNVVQMADIKNVRYSLIRMEELTEKYDFISSRAVARFAKFIPWVRDLVRCGQEQDLKPGLLYLKGGDLQEEIAEVEGMIGSHKVFPLDAWFDESFFESKSLVHIPFCE